MNERSRVHKQQKEEMSREAERKRGEAVQTEGVGARGESGGTEWSAVVACQSAAHTDPSGPSFPSVCGLWLTPCVHGAPAHGKLVRR